jgi:PAS domain S-box-containing protein
MSGDDLRQRVQSRDRLMLSAEIAGSSLHDEALAALRRGDLAAAEAAVLRNDEAMRALVEDMRIYQAELHAQAAELDESRERIGMLKARFESLFTNLPVAVLLLDGSGAVLEANRQAQAMFGRDEHGAAPRFLHRLVSAATYQSRLRPALLRVGMDRVTSIDDVDCITADGRRFVGEMHLAAMPEEPGRPPQLACAVLDRAQHIEAVRAKSAAAAAELASRSKSAFLSRMSHELRTPLNAILGFSQLMRLEAEAGDLVVKPQRVGFIETAARHLLDLINEVLDVSRIESGRMEVVRVPVELGGLVRECLPLVHGAAEQAGIELVDGLRDGPPHTVLADRLRLKEVLINLLSNAVKFNRPGGRVELLATAQDGRLELRVIDTGVGLQPQQLGELFEPFQRAGADSRGIQGSGLGLYVSRHFAQLMGGSLEAASEPGVGSTFTLRLERAGVEPPVAESP